MIVNRVPSEAGQEPGPGGLSTSRSLGLLKDPALRRSVEPRSGRERGPRSSSQEPWSARTQSRPGAPARVDRRGQELFDRRVETESVFHLENDPALITPLLAQLREAAAQLGLFDDDTAGRVAVALTEALLNGIQHGNLELDSQLRQDDDATYYQLAEFRRHRAPYRDRRLHVRARLTRREAVYRIRDEGPGFDPARLSDPIDPAHLERPSGRGLLLVRAFMDEVAFNSAGNQITLIKRGTTTPDTRGL